MNVQTTGATGFKAASSNNKQTSDSNSNAHDMSNYYTRAEIDAKFAELKSKQANPVVNPINAPADSNSVRNK